MRQWWVSWPMAVSLVASVVNVEFILIPVFVSMGMSGLTLFVATGISASIEVTYWYWFAGWLGRQAPFIPSVQATVREFRGEGFAGRVRGQIEAARVLLITMWDWFTERMQNQMAARNPASRFLLENALRVMQASPKGMLYPLMMGLGLCPLGWIPGILLCRQTRQRGAFATLLLFNAIKTYAVGLGWTAALQQFAQ